MRRIWQEELLGGFWVSGLEFAEPPVELLPVLRSHVTGMFEGVARRRSFRLPRVEEVAVGSPSANRWLSATSIDFSAEGVRIITDRYAAEGDLVPLRLSAGEDTLYALAEVAWIRHLSMRNLEMGLRLIEMGPRTAGLFRGLLEDDERP
ncbi:MAG: PilZ domain-containing protein [Armatimonadetes bacterium]|nr:PilZ domain-containing protein [Armatimonadota bacterium]